MKEKVLYFFAALGLLGACVPQEENRRDEPVLRVAQASITIGSEGGSREVEITSSLDWSQEVSSGSNWLTAESAGNAVKVTAQPSTLHQARMGAVTVTSGTLSKVISVTQLPAPNNDRIEVSPSSLSFENEGGSKTVSVTANVPVAAVSSESWLSVQEPASQSSPMTYTLTVGANTTSMVRTATVTFSGGDAEPVTVSVSQNPAAFIFPDKTEVSVDEKGGSVPLHVSANTQWTASASESWVSVSPANGQDTDITLTIAENTGRDERSATVTLAGGSVSTAITVKQDGVPPAPGEEVQLALWRCDDATYVESHSPDWSTNGANATSHGTGLGIGLPEDGAPAGTRMTWIRSRELSFDLVYITAAEGHYAVKAVAGGDGFLFTIPGQTFRKGQVLKMDCALGSGANSSPKNWVIKFRTSESAEWTVGESESAFMTASGATAHMVCTKTKDYTVASRFQATYTLPESISDATVQIFVCAADDETLKGTTAAGSTMRLIPLANASGGRDYPGPRITIR